MAAPRGQAVAARRPRPRARPARPASTASERRIPRSHSSSATRDEWARGGPAGRPSAGANGQASDAEPRHRQRRRARRAWSGAPRGLANRDGQSSAAAEYGTQAARGQPSDGTTHVTGPRRTRCRRANARRGRAGRRPARGRESIPPPDALDEDGRARRGTQGRTARPSSAELRGDGQRRRVRDEASGRAALLRAGLALGGCAPSPTPASGWSRNTSTVSSTRRERSLVTSRADRVLARRDAEARAAERARRAGRRSRRSASRRSPATSGERERDGEERGEARLRVGEEEPGEEERDQRARRRSR